MIEMTKIPNSNTERQRRVELEVLQQNDYELCYKFHSMPYCERVSLKRVQEWEPMPKDYDLSCMTGQSFTYGFKRTEFVVTGVNRNFGDPMLTVESTGPCMNRMCPQARCPKTCNINAQALYSRLVGTSKITTKSLRNALFKSRFQCPYYRARAPSSTQAVPLPEPQAASSSVAASVAA
jgi:hypothetical protein